MRQWKARSARRAGTGTSLSRENDALREKIAALSGPAIDGAEDAALENRSSASGAKSPGSSPPGRPKNGTIWLPRRGGFHLQAPRRACWSSRRTSEGPRRSRKVLGGGSPVRARPTGDPPDSFVAFPIDKLIEAGKGRQVPARGETSSASRRRRRTKRSRPRNGTAPSRSSSRSWR